MATEASRSAASAVRRIMETLWAREENGTYALDLSLVQSPGSAPEITVQGDFNGRKGSRPAAASRQRSRHSTTRSCRGDARHRPGMIAALFRGQQAIEPGLAGADLLEPWIAQAAMIADLDLVDPVAALHEQDDRVPVGPGGGDRRLQPVIAIGRAVYRNDRIADGQPGLEGGAVPADRSDRGFLAHHPAHRIGQVGLLA